MKVITSIICNETKYSTGGFNILCKVKIRVCVRTCARVCGVGVTDAIKQLLTYAYKHCRNDLTVVLHLWQYTRTCGRRKPLIPRSTSWEREAALLVE
jgi:hypothetical protein